MAESPKKVFTIVTFSELADKTLKTTNIKAVKITKTIFFITPPFLLFNF
jgi:hypothetical protein